MTLAFFILVGIFVVLPLGSMAIIVNVRKKTRSTS
jgi:hypothetical protein